MTAPTPPEPAAAFYAQGQTVLAAVLLALQNLWAQFDPANINASFAAMLQQLGSVLAAGQVAAARQASDYVPALLGELGLDDGRPQGVIRPPAFVGSSSGVTLAETLDTVRLRALHAAAEGQDPAEAGLRLLTGVARTQIADAARLATSTEIAVRPWVTGWVRMINPPACDRCILLAGRFYLWSDGFERHEGCDCRHIPADEDHADDLRTSPDAYFRSLTEDEQNRAFGKNRAQAIRDGADLSQVVNSRSGVRTAQVYGRPLRITSSGTSARGAFGRQQRDLAKRNGSRYRVSKTPRLTPESLYKIAKNRDDAIRLLRYYAYIT
ncbi:VG15 protein [Blastococcus sp. SYSU D00813]